MMSLWICIFYKKDPYNINTKKNSDSEKNIELDLLTKIVQIKERPAFEIF